MLPRQSYLGGGSRRSRRGTPSGKRATPENLFVPDGERASPSPGIDGKGDGARERGRGEREKMGKIKRKKGGRKEEKRRLKEGGRVKRRLGQRVKRGTGVEGSWKSREGRGRRKGLPSQGDGRKERSLATLPGRNKGPRKTPKSPRSRIRCRTLDGVREFQRPPSCSSFSSFSLGVPWILVRPEKPLNNF